MTKLILKIIFILGLIYVILPGPSKIEDFPAIQSSLKSDEAGDITDFPNIAAYYSEFTRAEITNFYRNAYRKNFVFGWVLPPVYLNYPPEDSKKFIRNYQVSTTFLEEYVYPLHGSIFVNGYEPYIESELLGKPHGPLQDRMGVGDKFFASKTTIRYYPNSWYYRFLVYLGIWIFSVAVFKVGKRIVLG